MIELKQEVAHVLAALAELDRRGEHREPLMRSLSGTMLDEVEQNFAAQGRPAWAGLAPSTLKRRPGGKVLQDTRRLASSIESASDNDSAQVGTNVVYAAIQHFGGEIKRAARSQRVYFKQGKDGSVGTRFVKKSQSNFSQWATIGEHSVKIPARPFLVLTESGIQTMEEQSIRYLSEPWK